MALATGAPTTQVAVVPSGLVSPLNVWLVSRYRLSRPSLLASVLRQPRRGCDLRRR
jgi:hypothetical protein